MIVQSWTIAGKKETDRQIDNMSGTVRYEESKLNSRSTQPSYSHSAHWRLRVEFTTEYPRRYVAEIVCAAALYTIKYCALFSLGLPTFPDTELL